MLARPDPGRAAGDAGGARGAQPGRRSWSPSSTAPPAGQTVYHLHFHIIPRWEGVPLGRHAAGGMADPAELKALAAQIAAKIS